jgi:hypothetical protein
MTRMRRKTADQTTIRSGGIRVIRVPISDCSSRFNIQRQERIRAVAHLAGCAMHDEHLPASRCFRIKTQRECPADSTASRNL